MRFDPTILEAITICGTDPKGKWHEVTYPVDGFETLKDLQFFVRTIISEGKCGKQDFWEWECL